MKFIVLGGAGGMGGRTVEDLAFTEGVEKVTVADRNTAGARALAERLRGASAEVDVVAVDADDHDDLVRAMRGFDVAASALGPFHRFEVKLAKAAIDAGVHYASICDEWDAAEAVIDGCDVSARKSGVIVLTGLGASPGVTSVGFRALHDRFDRLRNVDIYCCVPLEVGGGPAVIKHILYVMSGMVAVRRKGRRVLLPALSEKREIELPHLGRVPLWLMGHSEPVTIPRFFPDVEEVNFFMGYGFGTEAFVYPAHWGFFRNPRMLDAWTRVLLAVERAIPKNPSALGAIRIDAFGDKNGKPAHETLCGTGKMRDVTGLSLSVGALMIAKGFLTVRDGGVYAPEAALDPTSTIQALREKGIEMYRDCAMTLPAF